MYQGLGQIVPDSSGNGYTMVNGNSLDTDSEDVTWTARGAYISSGTGIYVAPPSISNTGFVLPSIFTMTIWAYPFTTNWGFLLQKGEIQIYTYKTFGNRYMSIMYKGYYGPYLSVNFGILYIGQWILITMIQEYTGNFREFTLFINDRTMSYSFSSSWTDSGSQLLVVGTSLLSAYQSAFIYELVVYNGLVPSSEISPGSLYLQNASCVYPNFEGDCISTCEDPNKNPSCSTTCSCTEGCNDALECLECDSVCGNFCASTTTSCLDIVTICDPFPYDSTQSTCNFSPICISNCLSCYDNTECTSCNSGYSLQPDLTCDVGCPLLYFDDNEVCMRCHNDCSSCSGSSQADCTSCQDSNSSLISTPGVCQCNAGYFSSITNPLSCSACHADCSTCEGPSQNECLSCNDSNASVQAGTCVCNSGFYQGSSCLSCDPECATCTGASSSDCLTCSDSTKELDGTSCVCMHSFFLDDDDCEPCHSDCATCTGDLANDCQTCVHALKEISSGYCVCIAGYYLDSSNECQNCHTDCATCDGPDQNNCLSCSDSLMNAVSGSCVCPTDSFEDSGSCSSCHSECATCTGPLNTDCLSCADLNQSVVSELCTCNAGFYLNGTACSACHSDCATCTGSLSTDCSSCTDSDKTEIDGSCICNTGFYNNRGSCNACHSDCATCTGPLDSDCSSCTDLDKEVSSGSCVCKEGFYEIDTECNACFEGCSVCTGPEESDCINCDFPNGYIKGSECDCEDGFYLSGTEECSRCDSNCKTCDGSLSSNCLTCTEKSSLSSTGECSCDQGYYAKRNSPLECEACPEQCTSCDESGCLSCSNPEMKIEDNCVCKEGYFLSDENICEECSSECKTCSDESNCTECEDTKREPIEGVCNCKSDYCEDKGSCKDCGAIPEETELTTEGQVGAVSAGAAVGISFMSMVTLEDPTVLWTIANISQIICYISILEIPFSGTFYQFLLSYQSMGFLPNVFIGFEGSVSPPASYQKFGYLKEEYVNTNFFRNSGRILLLLFAVLGVHLLVHLLSFLLNAKWKQKFRKFSNSWVSTMLKLLLTMLLDLFVPCTVTIFDNNYESGIASTQIAIVVMSMYGVFPLVLFLFLKYKEKIRNEDETIKNYIGSIYESLNLESELSYYYEILLVLRRLTFGLTLYFYHKEPLVVLIIQLMFSLSLTVYICAGRIYSKTITFIINSLAEFVLFLTVGGCILIYSYDVGQSLEYLLMGVNIGFILCASSLNLIGACIGKLCKRKSSANISKTIEYNEPHSPVRIFSRPNLVNNEIDNQRRVQSIELILNRKTLTNNIIYMGDMEEGEC